MRRLILLWTLSLSLMVATACTPTPAPNPNGGGDNPDKPLTDNEYAIQAGKAVQKYLIDEAGQSKLVDAFLLSIREKDFVKAKTMVSPFANQEITVQYGSWDAYAMASTTSEKRLGAAKALFSIPRPYQKPGESGVWVIRTLGEFSEASSLGFYLELQNGQWKIDNILSPQPLRIGTSAPAIGMSMNQPVIAFFAYFQGAFMAKHPPSHAEFVAHQEKRELPKSPWSDVTLTLKERLAYLRQSCTEGFIANIEKTMGSKDVVGFLNQGRTVMGTKYLKPTLLSHQRGPSVIHYQLAPNRKAENPPKKAIIQELQCVKIHGVWQLNAQGKVR